MVAARVLIVDDQEVIRKGIASILADEPSLVVVAHAASGSEAVRKAEDLQPDVVLLDLGIPELNGLVVVPMIKKVSPHSEILIVTQYDHPYLANHAFASGARGFLSKRDLPEELLPAVREIRAKNRYISSNVKSAVIPAELPTD